MSVCTLERDLLHSRDPFPDTGPERGPSLRAGGCRRRTTELVLITSAKELPAYLLQQSTDPEPRYPSRTESFGHDGDSGDSKVRYERVG